MNKMARNKNVELNVQNYASLPNPRELAVFQIVYCIEEQKRYIVDTNYQYVEYKPS